MEKRFRDGLAALRDFNARTKARAAERHDNMLREKRAAIARLDGRQLVARAEMLRLDIQCNAVIGECATATRDELAMVHAEMQERES